MVSHWIGLSFLVSNFNVIRTQDSIYNKLYFSLVLLQVVPNVIKTVFMDVLNYVGVGKQAFSEQI